jgi:hypothetical protein
MRFPSTRHTVATALIACGLLILIYGIYLSDSDHDLAWYVFSIGAVLVGIGMFLPVVRPLWLPLIAISSPLFASFVVGLIFWLAGFFYIFVLPRISAMWHG